MAVPAQRAPRVPAWKLGLVALALVAAVFAAFAPALGAHFINWDDPSNLEDLARGAGDPWHWFTTTGSVDPYQPLSWWSLSIDHALWGLSPGLDAPQAARFHATSVLIHALAAVAFFFVARRLLAITVNDASERWSVPAAALAALLFAVHPLRCESVV